VVINAVKHCLHKIKSNTQHSGKYLRGEGLVWLIGAVVCSLAAAAGPIVPYRMQWMTALGLQHHWPSTATSDDCKKHG